MILQRNTIRLALLLGLVLLFGLSTSDSLSTEKTHGDIAGPPDIQANDNELSKTIITAHLEQNHKKGYNILWCATFQLAWNELIQLNGDAIHYRNEPEMVLYLNKQSITKEHLNENSYIALAGFIEDGILHEIENSLQNKFQGMASPVLLKEVVQFPSGPVAYSYFFKTLPFVWAFERLDHPFNRFGSSLTAFGIMQFSNEQLNEVRAASQLSIYDYRNEDDYIIELKTRSSEDQLLLAKLPPQISLLETVKCVLNRYNNSEPKELSLMTSMIIPIINFDITRTYRELYNKQIISNNKRLNGSGLVLAKQRIRFKLDETGATVFSEGTMYAGSGVGHVIFDKPFLVLLKKSGSSMPYFALWIANSDLLTPYEQAEND